MQLLSLELQETWKPIFDGYKDFSIRRVVLGRLVLCVVGSILLESGRWMSFLSFDHKDNL